MKRITTSITALLLTTASALAQPSPVMERGFWTMYAGKSLQGSPFCGLSTFFRGDGKSATGSVHINFIKGYRIYMQIFKSTWSGFPEGRAVKASFFFDDYRANGTGYTHPGKDGNPDMVEFTVAPNFSGTFMGQFADAKNLKIQFHEGNEPIWNANLSGSRETSKAFLACVENLGGIKGDDAPPSKPFDDNPSTKPFGGSA
jgi:hypothetical protein